MKHFHNKKDFGDNDIKYIVVDNGQKYNLQFLLVDKEFDGVELRQGVKLWLNRCKLIIDNKVVPADKVIIWHSTEKKKPKVTGGHFHY